MGGLVVKRAYILGHQEAEFQPIVKRICSIVFLATPHQGSALAQTLSRLISLIPGARPFVQDLTPQSGLLQSVNEEFPRICSDLQLLSFYETRAMNLGAKSSLIVEKQNAVMNVPNERRTLLDADHRNVAMFTSHHDPTYLAVRNALATIVSSQRDSSRSHDRVLAQEDQTFLNHFLGITDAPEDDLLTLDSTRLPGSCEWFLGKNYYKSWKEGVDSRFLWVRGRPGAGKSMLSGHVVNDLRENGVDCSFFFFQTSDNGKATANACLRSLAWQMAMLHPAVRAKIAELKADFKGNSIDMVDSGLVWRKIFLSRILKVRLDRPQFWVLDAMDECKGSIDLMGHLARIQEQWPISILVTSRDSLEAHLGNANPRMDVHEYTISDDDSKCDITLFLKSNMELLPCPRSSKWSTPWDIAKHIIEKSGGCFLWASLICFELRQAFTEREIEQVLESIPPNMDALYTRILEDMSQARFGKDLAKSIITWTTYCFRPLSTAEIREPIEMDINDKVHDIERSISKCCGSLIYVDTHKRVQLVHSTAREFLTQKDRKSDFSVSKSEGHRRLAIICLQHLIKSSSAAPKPRRLGSDSDKTPAHNLASASPFTNYASTFVFQHLKLVSSKDDEIFLVLGKFLASPSVLHWVERIAASNDLGIIYQAGKTINALLARRAQHSPPMGFAQKSLALLEKWGDDLVHLVTKFSGWLKTTPHSIHHLIPAFCPQGSAIRELFCSTHRGLSVQGLSAYGWDDCLTTITYPKGVRPNTVATGPGFFAVGMMDRTIHLYDDSIAQEQHVLQHREPVWQMAFSASGKYLASAGAKMVRIWSPRKGLELMSFSIPSLCLTLAFGEDDAILRVVTRQNQLFEWDIECQDFCRDEPGSWTTDLEEAYQSRTPTIAALGNLTNLLCVIYRGEDIVLWDVVQERVHDVYEQDVGSKMYGSLKAAGGSATVRAIAFSEGLETNRLAATYTDGDLAIYDTLEGRLVESAAAVNAMLLASSQDGRTLAGCDSKGNLTLFEFETLRLLYRVRFDTSIIPKGLAFTADNHRFIEIRGDQCRVWEPTVLLRQDIAEDELSDTVSVATGPQETSYQEVNRNYISAIACSKSLDVVFCAKDDGSVHVYDIAGQSEGQQLFIQTAGCPIDILTLEEKPLQIACGDRSGRVTVRSIVRKIGPRRTTFWEVGEASANVRPAGQGLLKQVLMSHQHAKLLLVTEKFDSLWPIPSKEGDDDWDVQQEGEGRNRWAMNPREPDLVFCLTDDGLEFRSWSTLELIRSVSVSITGTLQQVISLQHPQAFATMSVGEAQEDQSAETFMQLWNYDDIEGVSSTTLSPEKEIDCSATGVERIIGAFGSRMVVFTSDRWVASIDIGSSYDTSLVRHFMIPGDWISVASKLIMGVGCVGEVLFAKQSDLAVIKRGLEVLDTGGSFNPRRGSVQRGGSLAVRHGRSRGTSPSGRSVPIS